MTIPLAEKLIRWEADWPDENNTAPQTFEAIKQELVERVMGEADKNQMKAFALRFKARTLYGQVQFLQQIHGFVRQNFPYRADGFSRQKLKVPGSIFYERSLGNDCKNLTYFIACLIYHLGLKLSLNFAINQVKKEGNLKFIEAHVYPAVWVGKQRIVMDATLGFNEEVAKKSIKEMEEILCLY